jgi:hypothetical protein
VSPTWRPEDEEQLVESRRIQAELAASAAVLMTLAQRLNQLAAELNDEAGRRDERGR